MSIFQFVCAFMHAVSLIYIPCVPLLICLFNYTMSTAKFAMQIHDFDVAMIHSVSDFQKSCLPFICHFEFMQLT
jgi:hypothetical protein